jgi:hypothetical protein
LVDFARWAPAEKPTQIVKPLVAANPEGEN